MERERETKTTEEDNNNDDESTITTKNNKKHINNKQELTSKIPQEQIFKKKNMVCLLKFIPPIDPMTTRIRSVLTYTTLVGSKKKDDVH